MKRKQVIALLLSATLAFGSASPVMAAEVKENEKPAVEAALEENTETKEETAKTDAEKEEAKEAEATEKEEALKETGKDDAAKDEAVKDEAAAPEEKQEVTAEVQAPTEEEQKNPNLITDEMLQAMSSSLLELVGQLEKDYTSMTDAEKKEAEEAFNKYLALTGLSSIDEVIKQMKLEVSTEKLKALIAGEAPEDADAILTQNEEIIVNEIDYLRQVIKEAKQFAAADKTAYMKEQIEIVLRQLSAVAYTTPELFEDEYIAGVEKRIKEIESIKYDANTSAEEHNRIVKVLEEAVAYLNQMNQYLSTFILEDTIKAAESYAAFLALAPESLLDQVAFDGLDQQNIKYKDSEAYAQEAKAEAEEGLRVFEQIFAEDVTPEVLEELGELMSLFKSYYYGNLVDAYKGIVSAIVTDVTAQADKINALGYTGSEKAAYEAALKEFNAVGEKEYAKYSPAAEKLQTALAQYKKAAEEFVVHQAKQKLAEALKAVEALQEEVEQNKEYYEDAYEQKVAEVLEALKKADPDQMTAEQISTLISEANTLVAERTENYTKEVYENIKDAETIIAEQTKWFNLMNEDTKKENQEAILLLENLKAQIKDGVVDDVDAFMKAYQAVKADLAKEDSLLMAARYAAADEIIENAEKYYKEESQKPHSEGLLEAFRAEIDALKESVKEWDDAKVMAQIQKVTEAKQKLLLDEVPQKPEKEDQKKPETDKKKDDAKKDNKKKAVNTGDTADAATPGILSILSLAGIAAVLGKKRR